MQEFNGGRVVVHALHGWPGGPLDTVICGAEGKTIIDSSERQARGLMVALRVAAYVHGAAFSPGCRVSFSLLK